jgi:hypothetical protein
MSRKKRHAVDIDFKMKNLPVDWRGRVSDVIKQVGKAFDLYVTQVHVGERQSPPGIRIAIAREGSDAVWTPKVELALRKRVVEMLEDARKDEIERQVRRMGFDRPVSMDTFVAATRISAVAEPFAGGPEDRKARGFRRQVARAELKAVLQEAELPSPAKDLVDIALTCMRDDERFSLWVRILLLVVEIEAEVSPALQKRLRDLL